MKAPPRRRAANGAGCPCCNGKKSSITNSLAATFPAIAAELDLDAPATGGLTADADRPSRKGGAAGPETCSLRPATARSPGRSR